MEGYLKVFVWIIGMEGLEGMSFKLSSVINTMLSGLWNKDVDSSIFLIHLIKRLTGSVEYSEEERVKCYIKLLQNLCQFERL